MTQFFIPNFFISQSLMFYITRFFSHFLVFFALLVQQILVTDFIDIDVSVYTYAACFIIFTIDSLCVFFYKDQQRFYFELIMLFVDVLFLSSLLLILQPSIGLFFVFSILIFQSTMLALFQRFFYTGVLLLYASILFPIALLCFNTFFIETRWSLMIFINASLLVMFFTYACIKYISKFMLQKNQQLAPETTQFIDFNMNNLVDTSIDLCKKLKPGLGSIIKTFQKEDTNPNTNIKKTESSSYKELTNMHAFICNTIECAELDPKFITKSLIDIRALVSQVVKNLETHVKRPQNLIQKITFLDNYKIQGSKQHLSKCVEHILLNSFEALQSQDKPSIDIQARLLDKSYFVLEFIDNGHGIQKEDISKMSWPFFSRRFGLRGMGLFYVQKIFTAHQATIQFENLKQGLKTSCIFKLHFDTNNLDTELVKKQAS